MRHLDTGIHSMISLTRPPCVGAAYTVEGCRNPRRRVSCCPTQFIWDKPGGITGTQIYPTYMLNTSSIASLFIIILLTISCSKKEEEKKELQYDTDGSYIYPLPCYSYTYLKFDLNSSIINNNVIKRVDRYVDNGGTNITPGFFTDSDTDTVMKYVLNINFPFTSNCSEQLILVVKNREELKKIPINSSKGNQTLNDQITISKHDTICFGIIGMATSKKINVSYIIN